MTIVSDACARCAEYWWGCARMGVFTPPEYERVNGVCEREGCVDAAQALTYMCWACRKFFCVACMQTMPARAADPTRFEAWLHAHRETLWASPERAKFVGTALHMTLDLTADGHATVGVHAVKIVRDATWGAVLERAACSAATILGANSVRFMHVQSHILCDWCVTHGYARDGDCWERKYT